MRSRLRTQFNVILIPTLLKAGLFPTGGDAYSALTFPKPVLQAGLLPASDPSPGRQPTPPSFQTIPIESSACLKSFLGCSNWKSSPTPP